MRRIFISIFLASLSLPATLWAQQDAEPSGNYNELALAVDGRGVLTGYYKNATNWDEDAFTPHFTCHLFITGKKQGDVYPIQAWLPTERDPRVIGGELSFLPP